MQQPKLQDSSVPERRNVSMICHGQICKTHTVLGYIGSNKGARLCAVFPA